MATRQGSLLGGKRADGARSAAKWLLSVAICLLLVQGGRTQTQSPSKFFLSICLSVFVLQLLVQLYKLVVSID